MKEKKSGKIVQLVFGILFIIASLAMFVSNLLIASAGWDVAYGMLGVLVFLLGLFMTVFGAAGLPRN